jgi:hypothetical protein
LLFVDHKGHKASSHDDSKNNQEYFLHVQCALQISPISVYAICAVSVPIGGKTWLWPLLGCCRPVAAILMNSAVKVAAERICLESRGQMAQKSANKECACILDG